MAMPPNILSLTQVAN